MDVARLEVNRTEFAVPAIETDETTDLRGTNVAVRRSPPRAAGIRDNVVAVGSGDRRTARRHRRVASTAASLAVFVILNLVAQLNRQYFDLKSDGNLHLRQIHNCETLGRIPDVLYLGSSLTYYGIDPVTVDSVVNAGHGRAILSCNASLVNSTFQEDYFALKRVIEDGFTPKLAVETVWEYNINGTAQPGPDDNTLPLLQARSLADLGDAGDFRPPDGNAVNQVTTVSEFAARKAIPMLGSGTGILRTLCGDLLIGPCGDGPSVIVDAGAAQVQRSHRGWGALVGQSVAANFAKLSRLYAPCGGCHFVYGGHQMRFLDKLVALSQAHGVRLVLLHTPLNHLFFAHNGLEQPEDWQRYITYWKTFADVHHVMFYDHSHDVALSDADFFDQYHLTPPGAKLFSTWVADAIIGPWAQGWADPRK